LSGRRLSFAPRPGVLRQLRADVRKAAIGLGAEAKVGDQLALVVDELVNNAIEHGVDYRRQGLDLALQIGASGDRLRIEFFDREMPAEAVDELARALGAAANGMPSLESERGRGLFLLSVYLQDVEASREPAGGLRLVGHITRQ
jgi:anti-sigma regulatory factor (Ser/Thr protein kinase)